MILFIYVSLDSEGVTFELGEKSCKAFLGMARRGGAAVQIPGASVGFTVQMVEGDELLAHALRREGQEGLAGYFEPGGRHHRKWDGVIVVRTPTGVGIACLTGHTSSASSAAHGRRVGVCESVAAVVVGMGAVINIHQPKPRDWATLSLENAVGYVVRQPGLNGEQEGREGAWISPGLKYQSRL